MMMKNSIGKIWDIHLKESSQNGIYKSRIDEIKHLKCFIGTVLRTKAKFFTIEIDKKHTIHSNYLKRFVGVEIQVLPSVEGKKELTPILMDMRQHIILQNFKRNTNH